MNSKSNSRGTANALLGVVFHAALAVFGGFALGLLIGIGAGGLWRGASREVQALVEFFPPRCFERFAGVVRDIPMVQPFCSLGRVVRISLAVHRGSGIVAWMESHLVASNAQ